MPEPRPAGRPGPLVEPHVAELVPYVPGRSERDVAALHGLSEVAALASNENPLGASPRALEAIAAALPRVHRYPDGGGVALRAALAERTGVPAEGIVLGNGSNELIELVVRTFLRPGEVVAFPVASFLVFRLVTRAAGGEVREVPCRGLTADVDRLIAAIDERTRIVFLANPNNPTGTWVTRADLERLVAAIPAGTVLVLDEAYAEYVTEPDLVSGLALLESQVPVIVLRTFSKIHGLATLRLGYALTRHLELASHLERVRQPFNANGLAQAAALAALADEEHVERSRRLVREGRPRLTRALEELGLVVEPSQGNFLLVDVGRDGPALAARLERRGVLVRPVAAYGLPRHLRITVGTEREHALLLAALERELAAGS